MALLINNKYIFELNWKIYILFTATFIGQNEEIETTRATEPDVIQSEDVKPVNPTDQVDPIEQAYPTQQQANPFLTSAKESLIPEEEPIKISEPDLDASQLVNPNSETNPSLDASQHLIPDSAHQEEQVNPEPVQDKAAFNTEEGKTMRFAIKCRLIYNIWCSWMVLNVQLSTRLRISCR